MKVKNLGFYLYSVLSLGIGGFILFMFTSLCVATASNSLKQDLILAIIDILYSASLLLSFALAFIASIGISCQKKWAFCLFKKAVYLAVLTSVLALIIFACCNIESFSLKTTLIYETLIAVVLFLIYILPGMVLVKRFTNNK